MPGKISEKDMEALADLIREKGYDVYREKDLSIFTFRAVKLKASNKGLGRIHSIYIGQYRGMFVSTHYIPGLPMSPLGEGDMRYQIAL